MCLALFIAADRPLPFVAPTSPPSFSVEELAERSLGVRGHFPTGWCVRYAGSTSGCGCDFRGNGSGPSRAALRDYLAALPPTTQVQIYVCWEGDETDPIEERIAATADALTAEGHEQVFDERFLITLTSH